MRNYAAFMLKKFRDSKLFKETFWGALSKGCTLVLYIFINIILARKLGVEKFGEWSFFFSVLTILFLFSALGINSSTKKFIASYSKTSFLKSVVHQSTKMRFQFTFVYTILVTVVLALVFYITKKDVFRYLLYSSPLLFFYSLCEYFKGVFEGMHRIKYNFLLNLFDFGLRLLLIIIVGFLAVLSIKNIIFIYTAVYLLVSLAGMSMIKQLLERTKAEEVRTIDIRKEILQYSWPLLIISMGLYISTEFDTVMIGLLSTNDQVAIYSIVKNLMSKTVHIALILGVGIMPIFANINQDNKEQLKFIFYRLLKIGLIIYAILAIGILVFADKIIMLLYGPDYAGAVPVMRIMTIYISYSSVTVFLSSLLDYQGKAKKRAMNLYICTFINIILNIILIPKYGAIGSAIGTSIAYLPYIILNWIEARVLFR